MFPGIWCTIKSLFISWERCFFLRATNELERGTSLPFTPLALLVFHFPKSSFLSSHECILSQLWHHPPGLLFFKKAKPTFFLKKNKQTAPSTVLVSNASLTCVCLFSQEYFYMSLCIFHFECLYHSQTSMLSFFATTRRNCLHTHILRKISVLLSQILELLVESHYESLQSYEKTWRRNIWVSE